MEQRVFASILPTPPWTNQQYTHCWFNTAPGLCMGILGDCPSLHWEMCTERLAVLGWQHEAMGAKSPQVPGLGRNICVVLFSQPCLLLHSCSQGFIILSFSHEPQPWPGPKACKNGDGLILPPVMLVEQHPGWGFFHRKWFKQNKWKLKKKKSEIKTQSAPTEFFSLALTEPLCDGDLTP